MLNDVRGKNTVVVGLARSGVGAANLLARLGAQVTVNDARPSDLFAGMIDRLDPSVQTCFGSHPAGLFALAELVVISPGVPTDLPVLKEAATRGVPVIGELELAYQVAMQVVRPAQAAPRFLAVTGTNGKSTTTTLLHEMMKRAGFHAILCGNIGTAVSETILASGLLDAPGSHRPVDFFVTELSSFQLETIADFHPTGATVLNITPDHLDRYHGMDEYLAAKCRVFANQGARDVLVLNADDPATSMIEKAVHDGNESPALYYFSRKRQVRGAYMLGGTLVLEFDGMRETLDPATFGIQGVHNIENAMAAALLAVTAGCPVSAVAEALREFPGLEHRLEKVRVLDGVQYINDSKGTNVGAVLKSLESFTSPVVLLAGGRDKDSDFRLLREHVRTSVKAAVLVGEAAESIAAAIGDVTTVYHEKDFHAAVARCHAISEPGDVVLLSPACASFDMFRDFEDRGRQFKALVQKL